MDKIGNTLIAMIANRRIDHKEEIQQQTTKTKELATNQCLSV